LRTTPQWIILIGMSDINHKSQPLIFRGREFRLEEIEVIKEVLKEYPFQTRRYQSRIICERLNWRQANGIVKDRACREVMLRMHHKGLIHCPPIRLKRRRKNQGGARKDKVTFQEPIYQITGKVGEYKELAFEMVRKTGKEALWDHLIDKYHYLGYQVVIGHYLKYLMYLDGKLIGCIGFADGVLHLLLRDQWIGWSPEVRRRNLHFIINNNRYLILPWVRVKYLSSKILAMISKRIRDDWDGFYGYKPLLIETFVDVEKFAGTSYKAANWIYLGRTQGKGRRGMEYFYHGKPKDIYVYSLVKEYRKELIE
jgi:hypothetical protein